MREGGGDDGGEGRGSGYGDRLRRRQKVAKGGESDDYG